MLHSEEGVNSFSRIPSPHPQHTHIPLHNQKRPLKNGTVRMTILNDHQEVGSEYLGALNQLVLYPNFST